MAPKTKRCVSKGKGPDRSSGGVIAGAAISTARVHSATFSDKTLLKGIAIGLAGGSGYVAPSRFPLLYPVLVFAVDKPTELIQRVSDEHHLTLRELITNAELMDAAKSELKKPQFLFGDAKLTLWLCCLGRADGSELWMEPILSL